MMMLGRLIMYLCGDHDSWDHAILMMGMMAAWAWAAWAVAWAVVWVAWAVVWVAWAE